MAELSTLARPYAKAAFEYAADAAELTDWSAQLAVAANVAKTEKVQKVLTSPSLTSVQQAELFLQVCGDELTGKLQNFIKVLAANKRIALLPDIYTLFQEFKANREKSVDVEIATAFELDATIQDQLAKALSTKLERDVRVQAAIDKSLLGGVIIRAADVVIDDSIRGRLSKLAEAIKI